MLPHSKLDKGQSKNVVVYYKLLVNTHTAIMTTAKILNRITAVQKFLGIDGCDCKWLWVSTTKKKKRKKRVSGYGLVVEASALDVIVWERNVRS